MCSCVLLDMLIYLLVSMEKVAQFAQSLKVVTKYIVHES